eukprot:TRINITY_DN64381_c0_g1_i1.p1 TRINITY_DN64381_c0_g1~~TRINITY_DN64381_c0_g1_i1.p1  ORF type:complete len:401 (-),score=58.87 TRINITY_DN64381_c0_g1_i1:1142-2344(-)
MVLFSVFVMSSFAYVAALEELLVQATTVATRGAAGWASFQIGGKDFLAVANFFTSSRTQQPRMQTTSAIYEVRLDNKGVLQLQELQRFPTVGAHGVEHCVHSGQDYLAIPNYYGSDTAVYRWDGSRFNELQRIKSDGAGSVEFFRSGGQQFLGIAEFNLGVASVYRLEGEYPNERFKPWQRIEAPGIGAMATMVVDREDGGKQLLLLCASYVTRQTGWHTRSPVFALNAAETAFERHHDVGTVGAHDVEVASVRGRKFVFFSNDKDERTTVQSSELFEWVGAFPSGRLESRQRVQTDGAHAAEFFSDPNGHRYFLAVANLGDRQAGTYRRDSVVYELDPSASIPLSVVQRLPTLGATDFCGFVLRDRSFLVVSNEQDDELGGDVESPIWQLELSKADEEL